MNDYTLCQPAMAVCGCSQLSAAHLLRPTTVCRKPGFTVSAIERCSVCSAGENDQGKGRARRHHLQDLLQPLLQRAADIVTKHAHLAEGRDRELLFQLLAHVAGNQTVLSGHAPAHQRTRVTCLNAFGSCAPTSTCLLGKPRNCTFLIPGY